MRAEKHIKMIERRICYLQEQVSKLTATVDAEKIVARASWIKAEIAALTWALPILKKHIQPDEVNDDGKNGAAILTK